MTHGIIAFYCINLGTAAFNQSIITLPFRQLKCLPCIYPTIPCSPWDDLPGAFQVATAAVGGRGGATSAGIGPSPAGPV